MLHVSNCESNLGIPIILLIFIIFFQKQIKLVKNFLFAIE